MLHGYNSFILHVNLEYVYEDLAEDVKTIFKISNYKIKAPLPITKNKKVMGLIKMYSYFKDDGCSDKKGKGIEV